MKPGIPTLRLVAEAAGVHPSTASRALDPDRRHLIAADVRSRVLEAAQRLGYRRNIGAAALRTGRTRLVGVVLPDIANPVFGPILSGVEEALQAKGYSAVVANAGRSAEKALAAAGNLIARRVEGLVLATAQLVDPVVDLCRSEGMPVVLVNRAEASPRAPAVISDDRAGMGLAVRHLTGLGHVRIGHVAGPQNVSTGVWRMEGFHAAMAAAGLPPAPVAVAGDYTISAGAEAARRLLATARLTAIAAGNDLLALGCFAAITEAGLACPVDISVIGYNDMPLIDMVSPPLASVRISPEEMGRRAGHRLLSTIAGSRAAGGIELLAPSLVLRGSTAAPPAT